MDAQTCTSPVCNALSSRRALWETKVLKVQNDSEAISFQKWKLFLFCCTGELIT
jgi:hypothetical protein